MADGDNVITLPLARNGTTPPRPRLFPARPKKRLDIDDDTVVRSVLRRAKEIDEDRNRGQWLDARLQRYSKYRGWRVEEKTYPWPGCSDVHIPMLQWAELRTNAGLHNVVMTLRPLMSAKASGRAGMAREEKITQVVDYQLFLEPGPEVAERRLTDFIAGGLQDGNAVAYTPWVRDERTMTQTFYWEPIPEGMAPSAYIEERLHGIFKGLKPPIEMDDTLNHVFYVTYEERKTEREATVEIYEEEDGTLEVLVLREVTIYDGPVALPLPIEHVLVPGRCTNLQPPSEANPTGAPYVFLRFTYRYDDVVRLKKSGSFNALTDEGLDALKKAALGSAGLLASATAPTTDELQQQKDIIEGTDTRAVDSQDPEDIGHLPVRLLLCFDRWDINSDGLAEDVFWVVAENGEVLCEARALTERWPALKPYRPTAEWCPIPVKDRWYGISLLELGESLYDLVKGTFDQSFDSWTIGNLPFFFYGAGSKLNTDVLSVQPGQGVPVPGNPRETILFPNLPQRDQSGAIGIIGLALQFFQQQMASGQLQQGQVPTGKASALRTFGTTMALLQQGDVRADQLLIRLFQGVAQIALNFHRMNRHLLPPGKEIRVVGWDGSDATGYKTIESAEEIDAEVEYEFRPEFLNSSPAVLRESLQMAMQVLMQPLVMQSGIVTPEHVFRLIGDFLKALRLDKKRYTASPIPDALPGVLAEEAVQMLMQGKEIVARPLEGAEAHLQKLFEWMNSDDFGMLPREHVPLVDAWVKQVAERARADRMAMAAQQFQQTMQSGQSGGVPTAVAEPAAGGEPAATSDALTAEVTGA